MALISNLYAHKQVLRRKNRDYLAMGENIKGEACNKEEINSNLEMKRLPDTVRYTSINQYIDQISLVSLVQDTIEGLEMRKLHDGQYSFVCPSLMGVCDYRCIA